MASRYADTHAELRALAADLCGGADHDVSWPRLADAGLIGLEAPEEVGGSAATFAETAIVLEELGRSAARSAYLSAVLSVGALILLQPDAERDAALADAAAGVVTAVALSGDHEGAVVDVPFRVDRSGAGLRLHGRSVFVADACAAERLLLLAHDPTGTPVIVAVTPASAGLSVTAQPVLDDTRRLAAVAADGPVDESSVWRFDGDADVAVQGLLDRARVAVACDSVGLSEAMLAATVSYAGVRRQFSRPIGSFQAVKHACADMLVRVSVARELVGAAVAAVGEGSRDATTAARMAKSYACEAAVEVAGKAMQLHGGIGYTWESGIHVYLKRAALNRAFFGSPAAHRRQLARRYRPLAGGVTWSP